MATDKLSRTAQVYVCAVIAAGLAAVLFSLHAAVTETTSARWLFFAALTLFSGSATVRLPGIPASLSVSETFVVTSVLLFGAPAGTLTVALDGLIMSLWVSGGRRNLRRILFNIAAPSVSVWIAGHLFFWIAQIDPIFGISTSPTVSELLPPLVAFTVVDFILNSSLVAIVVAFETGERASVIWKTNFAWLSLNFACGASVAALITALPRSGDNDLTYVGTILPVLFVMYITYRTTMGRVADANHHVDRMNQMYLSTIETLALAVDAKDQVTHGHIRRVQSFAVTLATRLGLSDPGLIQAIRAAALLHDMGKLAVPEHILNKPGRLTAVEFERMKSHAAIGADMLSSISFPYPVIPIVRHHHENWDGTGYPNRLRGTEIPIGARILSVVDCFDALTSDRPYRRQLSDDEAIAILLERRGKMYDPLVVDTFVGIVRSGELAEPTVNSELHAAAMALSRAIASNASSSSGSLAATAALEFGDAFKLCADITGLASNGRTADAVVTALRGLTQFTKADLLLLFVRDTQTETLAPAFASGPIDTRLLSFRIPIGERLTGWVAANRRPVLNGNPELDYADSEHGLFSEFACVLSVPVSLGEMQAGVLCAYSKQPEHFTARDQQSCEIVSPHIALAVLTAATDLNKRTANAA